MHSFVTRIQRRYWSPEDGQTMAEYGVVLAVITIAVFGALGLLSGNVRDAIIEVYAFLK